MTADYPPKSRWQRFLETIHLIISHHAPPYMHRCWHITFRGRTLHICARCSALLVGILLAFSIQLYVFYIEVTPLTFFGAFLLSLPAVIDWSTQTVGLRESRNYVRALTGFLLGYAVGYVLSSNNIIYLILVALLYAGYTISFGAIAPRITRWLHRRQSLHNEESSSLPVRLLPPQHELSENGDEE